MGTQVGIVGAGSWGIALAHVLSGNGHDVTVWSRSEDSVSKLRAYRGHEDVIVVVVPSAHMRETIRRMKPFINESEEHKQIIVNCSKGIEEESLMVMSDVILDELPGCHVCVLSGPSHAEEVGKSMPTTIVVGAFDKDIAKYVQIRFMNDYFRVYISPDMLGIEIGAALKNVVALAAGIADGFGCGDNAKAALITRGIAEISRLGVKMGGKFETFSGLSGIGDLIVTCASMHSRNRRAGILIGQGKTYKEAMDEVNMVVEGVYSAKAALKLAEKYEVEMPIIEAVNDILFNGKSLQDAIKDLMLRDRKTENSMLEW